MDIKHHVIVSTLLAIFIYPTYGIFALLVFLGGVLIDVDHYLWYIVVKKSFSIKLKYIFLVIINFGILRKIFITA